MCGIVGGFIEPRRVVKMLGRIQHRGFMSAGIATNRWYWRSHGTVQDLDRQYADHYVGDYGVGHVRYCTNADDQKIQPVLHFGDGHGFDAMAFNGQVEDGDTDRLFDAIRSRDLKSIKGAYCYVWIDSQTCTIKAGRDPCGFHPLYYSPSHRVVASETCADLDIRDWKSVTPGTEINVQNGRVLSRRPATPARCFFEYVYFSSVQSEFDSVNVWKERRRLGELLAERETVKPDMIVPVPDSSIAAAQAMAEAMQVPLRFALYRDPYAKRTFVVEGGQSSKYRLIPEALYGKVIVVDDSIVRGRTMDYLVPRLKNYCDEVHIRVTCPKITHPCHFGINITEAGAHTIEGADSVRFLDPTDVDIHPGEMCKACVTGEYPCCGNGGSNERL